jgi:selenocysteine lyase/cysteine desulfurase
MCEALRFLQTIPRSEEQSRVNHLCLALRNSLQERGLRLLTPEDPTLSSGIISFEHPQATTIGEALERDGVVVWAGDGRVRASLHYYNDSSDTNLYLQKLDSVLESVAAMEPSKT